MSRKTWVEITCDNCGEANYYLYPTTNQALREEYIIEKYKHFCCESCYIEYHSLPEKTEDDY